MDFEASMHIYIYIYILEQNTSKNEKQSRIIIESVDSISRDEPDSP